MKKKVILTIIFLAILPLITTGLTLMSIKNTQSVNSNAEAILPNINPPYVRLVTDKNSFKVGDDIPVHILVNTGGEQTLESHFVIAFDQSVLNINPEDLQNNNIYPVKDIETIASGKAIFSLFAKNEAGYSPISLPLELEVATLHFHAIGSSKTTKIDLVVSQIDETTSIISSFPDPKIDETNILRATEGVSIIIE